MSGSKDECDAHRAWDMCKRIDEDEIKRLLSLVNAVNVDIKFIRQQYNLVVAEADRLQAIVDNVLATADGVLIYPGCGIDRVWSIVTWSRNQCGAKGVPYDPYDLPLHFLDYDDTDSTSDIMIEDAAGYSDFVEKCYSTRKAALASRHPDKNE